MTLVGNHTVHIKVKGSGFVAQLVESLTKGFNKDADAFVNRTLSNDHCLPRPTRLKNYYWAKIGVLFGCMLAFVLLEHVPKRVRRWICAWYFPKREKQRTVFLYNDLAAAQRNHQALNFSVNW